MMDNKSLVLELSIPFIEFDGLISIIQSSKNIFIKWLQPEERNKLLLWSARKGILRIVKEIIEYSPISIINTLCIACNCGHEDIVDFLLRRDIKCLHWSVALTDYAIVSNNTKIIEKMLDYGIKKKWDTPHVKNNISKELVKAYIYNCKDVFATILYHPITPEDEAYCICLSIIINDRRCCALRGNNIIHMMLESLKKNASDDNIRGEALRFMVYYFKQLNGDKNIVRNMRNHCQCLYCKFWLAITK